MCTDDANDSIGLKLDKLTGNMTPECFTLESGKIQYWKSPYRDGKVTILASKVLTF